MNPALLVIWVAALTAAAPQKPARFGGFRLKASRLESVARQPGQGQVTSVTAQRAFIDRGSEDGLAVGAKVQLFRGARSAATCEIESVGPHVATCKPGAIRLGDRFTVDKKSTAVVARAPAPPSTPEQLGPRLEQLTDAEQPLVDFVGGKAFAEAGVTAELALVHASVAAFASPDSAFHQERAEVAVYGNQLFGGLSFGARLTPIIWSRRPRAYQSPRTSLAQLEVRELWAAWQFKNGFRLAGGRLTPRGAPGAGIVDGAAIGWTSEQGGISFGAYGGAMPSPVSLTPLGGPYTAGAYLVARLGGETVKSVAFEPSVRLAWVGRPGTNRFETQALMKLWWGAAFDARLEAAAGFGDGASLTRLDAVRFDAGARVADILRLRIGARYSGGGDPWLGTAPILPSQAIHADALAALELPVGFTLLVQGGGLYDLTTGLAQGRVGPELVLPPFFNGGFTLGVGYDEEFGWMPGRSGYLQVAVRPVPRLSIWSRASVFHRSLAPGAEGLASVDGALSLAIDLRLGRWFFVRGSGWARVGLVGEAFPGALHGQLALGASF